MQMAKLRNRERESRRLCLLRKPSAASSAALLKQGVCACARTQTHLQSDLSDEREKRVLRRKRLRTARLRRKRWRNILFLLQHFFPPSACVHSVFLENKEIQLKEDIFSSQTDEAVWRGLACTDATPGCTCRVSTVSNFSGPLRESKISLEGVFSWFFSIFWF